MDPMRRGPCPLCEEVFCGRACYCVTTQVLCLLGAIVSHMCCCVTQVLLCHDTGAVVVTTQVLLCHDIGAVLASPWVLLCHDTGAVLASPCLCDPCFINCRIVLLLYPAHIAIAPLWHSQQCAFQLPG